MFNIAVINNHTGVEADTASKADERHTSYPSAALPCGAGEAGACCCAPPTPEEDSPATGPGHFVCGFLFFWVLVFFFGFWFFFLFFFFGGSCQSGRGLRLCFHHVSSGSWHVNTYTLLAESHSWMSSYIYGYDITTSSSCLTHLNGD